MSILVNEKNINYLLLSVIVLFPWFFLVFQGLDILELGYWLVSFENFFTHPEVIPDIVFGSWLTAFFGAFADLIFEEFGIIGHKIAFVIMLYLVLYVVYILLSPFTSKKKLLYYILIAEIFININTYTWVNYYILTILFYLLGLMFLYRGLISDKLYLFFIAGIILGLNFYVRIPNILGLSLLILIIYYDLITGKLQYRQLLKKIVTFLLGFLLAIVSVIFLMKMIGHYDLFLHQMNYLLSLFFSGSAGYGAGALERKFILLHFHAATSGMLLFTILSSLLLSIKYWISNKFHSLILFVLSALLALLLIYLSEVATTYYYTVYAGFIGLIYGSLLWITFKKYKVDPKFSTLAIASFLIFELTPLGSRAYKYQFIYGMYLAIPVIMIYLSSLREIKFGNFKIDEKNIKVFLSLFSITIIIYSMIVTIGYRAPANAENRWTMLYSVDHPKLIGIHLTKERAEALNELIPAMNKDSKNFSYIMTYEQISTISYLSELQPYLSNTYPLFLIPDEAKKVLKVASSKKSLPLVVRATTNTLPIGWPKNHQHVHTTDEKMNQVRVVIEDFLKKNNYQVVWRNNNFEILTPAAHDRKVR